MSTVTIPGNPSTYGPYSGQPVVIVSFAIPAGEWTAGMWAASSAANHGSLQFYSSTAIMDGFSHPYGYVPFDGTTGSFSAPLSDINVAAGGTFTCVMLGGDYSDGIAVTNIALVLTGTPPPPRPS